MRNTKRFLGLFMAAMMVLSCLAGMILVSAEGETTEIKPVLIYEGWMLEGSAHNSCNPSLYDYDKGYITLTATKEDPYYSLAAGMVAAPYMVMKYRTTASEGMMVEFYIGNGAGANGQTDHLTWGLTCGNEWTCDIVNIGELGDYNPATNELNHVRFDFFNNFEDGASMDVEYIAFFNTKDDAEAYVAGNMHKLPGIPNVYTATFVNEDGEAIRKVEYKEGAPAIVEPGVPNKPGMVGKWEPYTLNGDITIKPVYTEYNPHLFADFNHLDQFGEEHANYISYTDCIPTYNEDGTITYMGTWAIDADFDAKIRIEYYRLMQAFNGTGEKFKKDMLANADGDGNIVVFKVKGSYTMTESAPVLVLYAGLGGQKQEYTVEAMNVLKGDGSEEYIYFDLTGQDGYENLFITTMELSWACYYGTDENLRNTCTLMGIDMYATMDDALGYTGESMPETEAPTEKPTEAEDDSKEPSGNESTPAGDESNKTEDSGNASESGSENASENGSEKDSNASGSSSDKGSDEAKGGCGSVVATGAVVAVLAAAAAAVALKKKD